MFAKFDIFDAALLWCSNVWTILWNVDGCNLGCELDACGDVHFFFCIGSPPQKKKEQKPKT